MRVLIVDDSDFIRISVRKILQENNIEVAGEAVDGEDAIIKYRELKPDIVTMDITMPKLDGRDTISEILKIDPNAKIIVCSAMGQETVIMKAIMVGAKTFLVKPIQEKRLLEEIEKIKQMS